MPGCSLSAAFSSARDRSLTLNGDEAKVRARVRARARARARARLIDAVGALAAHQGQRRPNG